jgi:N-dimethylarginine dimethylaminohydrolase
MHDPHDGVALELLLEANLEKQNFMEKPDPALFTAQYDQFQCEVARHAEIVTLSSVLGGDTDFLHEAATNPNLMFTRDSSITLPWAPELFIPARLKLPTRENESVVVSRALEALGLTPAFRFIDDEYCEGGDVLPAMDGDNRTLLIGFGVRTTKAAALRLALELIPTYCDQIIGLSHDPDLLHLDTGFTILPNLVMFAAGGMFHSGFRIDEQRCLTRIDPIARAEAMGFAIVRCDKSDAITHERCNMLPLGGGRYIAFSMPPTLRAELETKASISIICVEGNEISKACGGAHCLTRPLYS